MFGHVCGHFRSPRQEQCCRHPAARGSDAAEHRAVRRPAPPPGAAWPDTQAEPRASGPAASPCPLGRLSCRGVREHAPVQPACLPPNSPSNMSPRRGRREAQGRTAAARLTQALLQSCFLQPIPLSAEACPDSAGLSVLAGHLHTADPSVAWPLAPLLCREMEAACKRGDMERWDSATCWVPLSCLSLQSHRGKWQFEGCNHVRLSGGRVSGSPFLTFSTSAPNRH